MAEGYTGSVTVTHAESKGDKENPHGGLLYRWSLDLTTKDGKDFGGVFYQRKTPDPITEGEEFHGEISEGQYGWRFKLTSPDGPGPRSNTNQGGLTGSRGSSNTPGAAAKGADSGDEPWWDQRDRRIEWSWACNLAVQELGPGSGRTLDHEEVAKRARLIIAHAHAELSSQINEGIPPTAPATGGAAHPAKGTDTPPPPTSDTAESVQADASKPLDAKGEKKLLKALNDSPIAKQHHDTLRAWYGADRVDGARKLWKALSDLDNGDVDAFLTQHGITPASDVPLEDDQDLPSTDDLEKRAAELGVEVVEG